MNSQFDTCWPDWKIAEEIGSGTYGHVYKIKREEKSHIYYDAMKVISIPKDTSEVNELINSGMDRENITEYFQDRADNLFREIDTMIQLGGFTNIVTYKDHKLIEHKDGIGYDLYIRMELLTPLSEYLLSHKITTNEVVQMGIDICKALELCEKHNIIHRDIKPANVFLSTHGDFELGDFGVSRTMNATTVGTVAGTYTYMAPEVYLNHAYNNTVDIYSLGMMMYQFLNGGRLPFMPPASEKIKPGDMETALLVRMKGDTPVPEITGISPTLSSVICKACSYESNQRYQSAREFREALQETISGKIPASRNNDVFISPDYIPEVGPTADNKNKLIDEAHADKSVASTIYQSEDEILQQKSQDEQQKESVPPMPTKKRPFWIIGVAAAVIVIVACILGLRGHGNTVEEKATETLHASESVISAPSSESTPSQTTAPTSTSATTSTPTSKPTPTPTTQVQTSSTPQYNDKIELDSNFYRDNGSYKAFEFSSWDLGDAGANSNAEVEKKVIEELEKAKQLRITDKVDLVDFVDITVTSDMLSALLTSGLDIDILTFSDCSIETCRESSADITVHALCFQNCTLNDTKWFNCITSIEDLSFTDYFSEQNAIVSGILDISSLDNLYALDCSGLTDETIEWPNGQELGTVNVTASMNQWSSDTRIEHLSLIVAVYSDAFDERYGCMFFFDDGESYSYSRERDEVYQYS